MKYIDEISKEELHGKRVLVRAGLDLSLDNAGKVADLFRVEKACPTLQYLKECGARVIILSHIGRDPSSTNAPVAEALSHFLNVSYVPDIFGEPAKSAIAAMQPGDILLLENLRQHYDLEKAKDETFAKNLAALGEIYVNDAFSNSHRDHASMTLLPKLVPAYGGMLLRDEITHLDQALHPQHPALAMIGGAKFETKVPVIKLFLERYDHAFVTGALANDVFKAQGLPVGRSLISAQLPEPSVYGNPRFVAPNDVTVENTEKQARVKKPHEVESDDKIVDIGPDTVHLLAPLISAAKFIIWNGPTGLYEDGYDSYTKALAELIAEAARGGAQVVIGGGDTIAAIEGTRLTKEPGAFLSTGGGAMLEFLLAGTLPAIQALG
ncbi:MAG: phosphoglycerate kinase [Candidatus Kaiserbacteria bacterium]|nr:phosphoglycerate kinase [Candidatus Kaiserbacteria bacterium]